MSSCSNTNVLFENTFIDDLKELSDGQKNFLENRYIATIKEYRARIWNYDSTYHYGRFISNVSSILVPALLSIQYTGINNVQNSEEYIKATFWITWFLSLTVTVINNTLGVFRVEKKYYLLHIIIGQLLAEGAHYSQLSGRYSGYLLNEGISPSHKNQYLFFMSAIERILMRETDIEYFRLYDTNHSLNIENNLGVTSNGNGDDNNKPTPPKTILAHAGQTLYHPSPQHPITPIEMYSDTEQKNVTVFPTGVTAKAPKNLFLSTQIDATNMDDNSP